MDIDIIRELSAIPIGVAGMYFIYRLATNHMNALASAVEKLADAIDDLKEYMRRG
ncbi:hypothetical protein LCGC14_0889080 [marine sediment metagenome]|uniref:YvrJ family protein n=1 Tax=marine sediment metagenome TaxID=412755 RepID=A0A0F9RJ32_9ZZZZ